MRIKPNVVTSATFLNKTSNYFVSSFLYLGVYVCPGSSKQKSVPSSSSTTLKNEQSRQLISFWANEPCISPPQKVPVTAQHILPRQSPPFTPSPSPPKAAGQTPRWATSLPPGSRPHFLNSQQFSFFAIPMPFIHLLHSLKQNFGRHVNQKYFICRFFPELPPPFLRFRLVKW